MAKKLIFQHQWGEEALREYQDHVISMVEDHLQICNTAGTFHALQAIVLLRSIGRG